MSEINDLAIARFLRCEFSRIGGEPDGVLLDLGCGTSPYRPIYRTRFDRCVRADRVARGDLDVRLDATALPFGDATFDVVLMAEVIEHVAETDLALREVARVLKPGGTLLLTWPFNYMLHEVPFDYARFTEFGMDHRLRAAGLRIERLVRRGGAIAVLLVLAEFLAGGLLHGLGRTPLVGGVFRGLERLLRAFFFGALYRGYLALTWPRTSQGGATVGFGLNGMLGHLSLWTLGYCARVRKPGEGS